MDGETGESVSVRRRISKTEEREEEQLSACLDWR